ncbi:hypothetical protein N7449_008647 [Penicillium cf. viridicatum]|uniref:Zn(2)-C6 fungal-type domain-containing protein n=1 Tax=Penicillium cf. viridicatum TaxID=2972119 RepID=A0A9W9M7V4_9EURO|nr:hypothetical protein N7449_008647 [Penicillium cf. viridicatum]
MAVTFATKRTPENTARRHAKACPKRHGRPLPPIEKKGKPRKSCDQCARNKTSCDTMSPCGYCKNNALSCAYSRVLPSPQQGVTATEETPSAPSGHFPDRLLKARIPFLLRYYDMNNTVLDLIPALDAGREKVVRSLNPPPQLGHSASMPLDATESYLDENHLDDFSFMWPNSIELNNHVTTHRAHSRPTNHQPCEILSQRAQELVQELKPFASCSISRASLKNAVDQDLFSAANIRAFEYLYVQHFHRHCPIIHLPSFQAQFATVPLLLATFLGGSLNSYPRDTYFLAVDCLDIAEAYLFSLPVFKAGYKHTATSESQVFEHYDALKAVVILLQLQIGRNDTETRRRVRYQRFPMLVHAARSTSLFGSRQHRDFPASGWWTWDAQSESLIR